jgi:hypothetical protein
MVPIRRALALLAGAALALPALVAGPALATDVAWSSQAQVPSAATSFGPSVATTSSTTYVAYRTSTSGIDYEIYTTDWWPKIRTVSGPKVDPVTAVSPSIVEFNGDLWAFWINSGGDLRYSDLVSGTWQPTQTVSGSWGTALSTAAPSLAVANGDLWIAYKGHTSDNIYYTDTNGTTWSNQLTAIQNVTALAPAIAPTGQSFAPLAFAWTQSNGDIGYGLLTATGFNDIGTVPSANTNMAPALAFMSAAPNGTMYLAWKGTTTKGVFYNDVPDFADTTFGTTSWAGQADLPNDYTSAGPALGVAGTTLWAVYTARSTTNIYYETGTEPSS